MRTGASSLFVLFAGAVLVSSSGCRGCMAEEQAPQPAPSNSNKEREPSSSAPRSPIPAPPSPTNGASSNGAKADEKSEEEGKPFLPPGVDLDRTGMQRCCEEVSDNAKRAIAEHRATWQAAVDACNKAIQSGKGRIELEKVRSVLEEVGWPAACQ